MIVPLAFSTPGDLDQFGVVAGVAHQPLDLQPHFRACFEQQAGLRVVAGEDRPSRPGALQLGQDGREVLCRPG